MDAERFDQITKILTAVGTRRGALVSLLTGHLGLLGLAETTAKKRRGGASVQGPCGNGSAKANACKHHRQCCTGYCHPKKDRCRCKKLGQECTESRNCCANFGQPMICQSGSCQPEQTAPSPPPPPPACTNVGGACVNNPDCCSQFCGDGICRAGVCMEIGQGCTAGADCCSGNCDDDPLPGECAPCEPNGTSCQFETQSRCCSRLCNEGADTFVNECVTCLTTPATCVPGPSNGCCPGLECPAMGEAPNFETCCVPTGGACTRNGHCCSDVCPGAPSGNCT